MASAQTQGTECVFAMLMLKETAKEGLLLSRKKEHSTDQCCSMMNSENAVSYVKEPGTKATDSVMPFVRNVRNTQVCRDRKVSS